MRNITALLLALLLGWAAPASAQSSKTSINTQIDTLFADNTSGGITPLKLRTVTKNIVASYIDWLSCTGSGGLVYWSTGTPTCLSIGGVSQFMVVSAGGLPSWATITPSTIGAVPTSRLVNTTAPLTGGGDLSADRTLSITSSALTKTDDTNVTLTLGGTPGFALLQPVTMTLGWTSTLALSRGGCAAALTASNGGILYSTASACAILAGTATARLPLLSGAGAAPQWGAYTLPASVTSGGVACFTSTTTEASSVALTANAIMLGGGAGACPTPLGSLGTTSTVLHGNAAGAPSFGAVANTDMSTMLDGTIKSNISGGTTTPSDNTITAVLDKLLGTTQGSIASRGASAWVSLPPGVAGQVLQSGGPAANVSWFTVAGTGTVTTLTAGTGITLSSGATCTTTCTVNVDKATAGNYYAGTSNKVPTADIIYTSEVTTTYGATTTFDFSTFINTVVTLTGNITTQTLSNVQAGKAGTITFVQDATGSRTSVWNSIFKFSGGTLPTLTTTASAVDVLSYSCRSATFCVASLIKDVK